MYSAFEDDLMDDWFYKDTNAQPRTPQYRNLLDSDQEIDEDNSWDRLLDPNARPSPPQMSAQPPPIAHGEVTTSGKAARERAFAQLIEHQHVGIPAGRGSPLGTPMYQQRPGENVGLALVDPRTGDVQYTVFDPSTRQVVWRGSIGTLSARQRGNPQGRENGVRRLLTTATQTFKRHKVHVGGADLVSHPPQQQSRKRQHTRGRQNNRFDAFAEIF